MDALAASSASHSASRASRAASAAWRSAADFSRRRHVLLVSLERPLELDQLGLAGGQLDLALVELAFACGSRLSHGRLEQGLGLVELGTAASLELVELVLALLEGREPGLELALPLRRGLGRGDGGSLGGRGLQLGLRLGQLGLGTSLHQLELALARREGGLARRELLALRREAAVELLESFGNLRLPALELRLALVQGGEQRRRFAGELLVALLLGLGADLLEAQLCEVTLGLGDRIGPLAFADCSHARVEILAEELGRRLVLGRADAQADVVDVDHRARRIIGRNRIVDVRALELGQALLDYTVVL